MHWSGTGIFARIYSWVNDAAANIAIEADRADQEDDSFADGINNCLAKDGQNTPTANLPMAGFRHQNVGNAAARNEYASVGQTQDDSYKFALATGAAGAYSLSLAPAVTTLVLGAQYAFQANHTNPGAVTLTINATGAKVVTLDDGATPLTGNEIASGAIVSVRYDGTQFRLNTAKISAFGRTLVGASDAAAARVNLALGTAAVLDIGTSGAVVPKLNGAGTTWADFIKIEKSTNTDFFYSKSTDGGASAGPENVLDRESVSPNAGDVLGIHRYYGRNTSGAVTQYGGAYAKILDATAASEDGALFWIVPIAGTGTTVMALGPGLAVGASVSDQGSGTINAQTNYYRAGTILPIQRTAESGDLAATAGAMVSYTHGLGARPKLYCAFIRCTSTNLNYAVGDEVQVGGFGTATVGCVVMADATTINLVIGSGGIPIINKTTFATTVITAANWAVVLRAWA